MAESKDTTEPTAWEKLRAPFPPEFIEKLPEVKDRATGKVKRPELDYVSAGHVIDRLLQVDPTWTWTWGVEDPVTGKPSKALSLTYEKDGSISLWMAMHVNGVVKVDVGYVSPGQYGMPDEPMKHVVSDAITRCARLFGVALDLWIGTPRPRPWDMGPVVIGADAIATTNAISYRARHDLPPSGIAAGVQGGQGRLRQLDYDISGHPRCTGGCPAADHGRDFPRQRPRHGGLGQAGTKGNAEVSEVCARPGCGIEP
jgi:hypothetical protein